MPWDALLVVGILAFCLNLPFGVWRHQVKKFSIYWFIAVHMSIPLIILFRNYTGLSFMWVPFTIGLAILGQFAGSFISSKVEI